MKIIKLTVKNQPQVIIQTLEAIKDNGIVVTPSETQYGLSADPADELAVKQIYAIKKMRIDKPLGLIAGSIDIIKKYFILNENELKITAKFWPGPLGLLLAPKENPQTQTLAKLTLGNKYNKSEPNHNKMVIRVTSNKFLAELSSKLAKPIISTSANISGQPACYDVECVIKQFKNTKVQPDLIIDAGPLPKNLPSTILDLSGDTPGIIRQGAEFAEIKKFLNSL